VGVVRAGGGGGGDGDRSRVVASSRRVRKSLTRSEGDRSLARSINGAARDRTGGSFARLRANERRTFAFGTVMPSLPSAFGPAVVGATVVVVIPTDAICVMRARRGPS